MHLMSDLSNEQITQSPNKTLTFYYACGGVYQWRLCVSVRARLCLTIPICCCLGHLNMEQNG